MNIVTREAKRADVRGMFDVRTSVTENHLSREQMQQLGITESVVADMIQQRRCAWVATADDTLVGFSMILPDEGCLFAAFVLPEYEGRGIGRRLVALAEEELFKYHESAWLETDEQSRAARFYLQLGWGDKQTIDGCDIRLTKRRRI